MAHREPDALTPDSWGGDADPQTRMRRARDEATIQQQHAAIQQASKEAADLQAKIARGEAQAPAAPDTPQYQRPNIPELRVPDIYEGMAEEHIRSSMIMQKSVQVDSPAELKVDGVASSLRNAAPVAVTPPSQVVPPPVAPPSPTAAQSALAAKRAATAGGALIPVATVHQLRAMVEAGQISVPGLIDLLGAMAELQFAIVEAMG